MIHLISPDAPRARTARTCTSNLIGSARSQSAEHRSRGGSSVRIQGTMPNERICLGSAVEARVKGLALEARRCGFEPRLVHNSIHRSSWTVSKEVNLGAATALRCAIRRGLRADQRANGGTSRPLQYAHGESSCALQRANGQASRSLQRANGIAYRAIAARVARRAH